MQSGAALLGRMVSSAEAAVAAAADGANFVLLQVRAPAVDADSVETVVTWLGAASASIVLFLFFVLKPLLAATARDGGCGTPGLMVRPTHCWTPATLHAALISVSPAV